MMFSVRVLFHRIDHPFQKVPCVTSFKGPCDTLDLVAESETLCLGARDQLDVDVKLMEFFQGGWDKIFSHTKRALKGSSLLSRYFLISGTMYWWNQSRKKRVPILQAFLYNQKSGTDIYLFPSGLWSWQLTDKGSPDHNLTAFAVRVN